MKKNIQISDTLTCKPYSEKRVITEIAFLDTVTLQIYSGISPSFNCTKRLNHPITIVCHLILENTSLYMKLYLFSLTIIQWSYRLKNCLKFRTNHYKHRVYIIATILLKAKLKPNQSIILQEAGCKFFTKISLLLQ